MGNRQPQSPSIFRAYKHAKQLAQLLTTPELSRSAIRMLTVLVLVADETLQVRMNVLDIRALTRSARSLSEAGALELISRGLITRQRGPGYGYTYTLLPNGAAS